MKRIILLALICLVFISFASAETFKQEQSIDFKKTCTNSSDSICSTVATCNITMRIPRNNSYIVNNQEMQNNDNGLFNYTLNSNQVSVLGTYTWDMFCCDGSCGEAHGNFQVTKTGVELSQDKAIVYLGMLALLVFLFIVNVGAIPLLPSKNTSDEEGFFVGVSNLKYVRAILYVTAWGLLMVLMFISSNISFLYLETTLMGDILFKFYQFMMLMTIPGLFLWFIFIFVSIFRDKEMKSLIERGVQVSSSP